MTNTHETQTQSNPTDDASFWRRKPTLLVAGAVAAAALLVGGVGLGSAIADDDDDRVAPAGRDSVADDTDDDADDTAPAADPAPVGAAYGAADAATLSTVLSTARDEAKGTPTSLEANRDGSWSVDLEAANGDETTVLVADDGSASVIRTEVADADDANDPKPAGQLNDANIAAIVDAALAEAKGVIVDISLDDNAAEAYSVQVLTDRGTETEIDLSTGFDVTQIDTDQD